ncbi:MAG: translation initiation factor IF-2 [Smithellaceae bacterium]|nr:translation initiation factor IF-2 [Smithellaceae bacterium]
MSKKRVYELAKELGIDNKEIITRMEKLGIAVKSHSSSLEDAEVERIERELRVKEPQEVVEQRIKSTVIRRRAVRTTAEEAELHPEAPDHEAQAEAFHEEQKTKPAEKPAQPVLETPGKKAPPVETAQTVPEITPTAETIPYEPKLPVKPEGEIAPVEVKPPPEDRTATPVEIIAKGETTPEKAAAKPVIPVRRAGVPFQTEGRKPLPEERRGFERPQVTPPVQARPKEQAPPAPPSAPFRREEGRPPYQRRDGAPTPANRPQTTSPVGRRDDRTGPPRPYTPSPSGPPRPYTPSPSGPSRPYSPPAVGGRRDGRPFPSAAPPSSPGHLEKPRRDQPDRFKGKGKKPAETFSADSVAAKKKAALVKVPELRTLIADPDKLDTSERPPRWREEKKAPSVKTMKKTVITVPKAIKRRIKVGEAITVAELAKKMGVKAGEIISKLIAQGLMVSINQPIDFDTATLIAADFSYQVEQAGDGYEDMVPKVESPSANLKPRAPVVTIMGHVDHGKTSLLDAVRETNVIDGEAGGITQAIGAYHVQIKGRDIVFLDTPGHEAFTAMRARGAQVTDIVVLVVAADDGVKEQTIEAINHARVAAVPILVAVNKIDKPGADTEKIKQVLTEYDLLAEEWGGETIFCEVSAKKKQGIEELLEMILLQADMMNLQADPDRPARGIIIEAKLDRGRGPVATVLIQEGTLNEGDAFVSKAESGRVRALINDQGKRVKTAGPSMPVEVIGFSGVPHVGSEFVCVEDEKKARDIGEYWIRKEREKDMRSSAKITLEQLYEKIREGVKDFNVIIKGDVQGSVEALSESLGKLSTSDVKLGIIHNSTGAITETDVMLASASNAIIIGFNVRPDGRVAELAEQEGVDIKLYDIIYNAIADVKAAMEGVLDPIFKEVVHGRAEVRNIFKVPKIGTVAGCYLNEGKIVRNHRVRLIRDGVVVYDGNIHSLKRFKDDVKEVLAGFECGISIDGFNDIKMGDIIEGYLKEQVERIPQ